jgi:hypothetical protein
VEVDRAVAEQAFVQQLRVHADIVVGEGALAASDDDRDEEQVVLVDQPRLDRLSCKRATTHGDTHSAAHPRRFLRGNETDPAPL